MAVIIKLAEIIQRVPSSENNMFPSAWRKTFLL